MNLPAALTAICLSMLGTHASAQHNPAASWDYVHSPTFAGWDQERLDALDGYVADSTATTGMMILQGGRVVYQYGNVTENSYIASCRKSVLAMLYGKHVEAGTIKLDATLAELGVTY